MKEDKLVVRAERVLARLLPSRLAVKRGESLFYQIRVDNRLDFEPPDPKRPMRGQSAFQTDLCIFERKKNLDIPRVVLEFKRGLSTHDVLTYSAKARRHKQVYRYLRYGLVVAKEKPALSKFYNHNEGLDFCLVANPSKIEKLLPQLVRKEVAASRQLERVATGAVETGLIRTEVILKSFP